MLELLICAVASVTDGDTLRCRSGERIRLAGIDAPEIGACPPRRRCTAGDAFAARRQLQRLVDGRSIRCEISGRSYDRLTAWCYRGTLDISCSLIHTGHARRLERYWRGHRC